MVRRSLRRPGSPDLRLSPEITARLREVLPRVGEDVVTAVIEEVPSYQDAWSGQMGATIQEAVGVALGGFLSVASGQSTEESVPATPASLEGAYALGRGEARSGRTTEALLAAYRIGARVAWRELSSAALEAGLPAEALVEFAALVFAWIDEVSDASVAGHAEELATTGRVRQRLLERLVRQLVAGATPEVLDDAAERADWTPPSTLTAALVPTSQVGAVLPLVVRATLMLEEVPGIEETTLLLVPDAHGRRRAPLLRTLEGRGAVVGPAKPWREARTSYERAARVLHSGWGPDTEAHLVPLVLGADADALADLRAAVLAPLSELRPGTAEKLTETLRSWLLHHGRRDEVAAELFVHPQTVRYRMGQLRELYGDRLEDPATVLALTVALG